MRIVRPRICALNAPAVAAVVATTLSISLGISVASIPAEARPERQPDVSERHQPQERSVPAEGRHRVQWVNGWQASPTDANTVRQPSCPSDVGLRGQTVRNIVVSSVSGDRVRVRLSNAFGRRVLRVESAAVAMARGDEPRVVAATRRPLRFSGRRAVAVPAGGSVLSDPVALRVRAGRELAISLHPRGRTGPATQHNFGAQQTSYLARGNATSSVRGLTYQRAIRCWLFAHTLDVRPTPRVRGTVVTLGDSLTDGFGSTSNRDRRYPDLLARRLRSRPGPTLSVSNAGISGNALLHPVPGMPEFGPPVLARLRRDVLARPHVSDVIVLIGVNDIGLNRESAAGLIAGHRQLVRRLHRAGLNVVGLTLPPFGGSRALLGDDYGSPRGERIRQRLNRWILTSGTYDAVVDAAALLRDPHHPRRLRPRFDSGDHLHPNDDGYAAIARAIDLDQLLRGAR
jgi:lysophospholipase L1-like esterase